MSLNRSSSPPPTTTSASDLRRPLAWGVHGHAWGLAAWGWTSGQAARCFLGFSRCSRRSVRTCAAAAGFPSGRFP